MTDYLRETHHEFLAASREAIANPKLQEILGQLSDTLGKRNRDAWAARLVEIDSEVKRIVAKLQAQGLKSPYLRNYVVARINPVRFHKLKKGETKPPMELPAALTRMAAAARKFDVASVRERDLALVAAVAGDPE